MPTATTQGRFLDLLNPFALACGLLSASMFLMQGGAWLVLKTTGALQARARRAASVGWTATIIAWVAVTLLSRADVPARWDAFSDILAWAVPALLVAALLAFPLAVRAGRDLVAFGLSSAAIAGLVAILGIGLYPNLVPARDAGASLTITNTASSDLTLTVMLIVAVMGMPIVLAYTALIYRSFWGPVKLDEASY